MIGCITNDYVLCAKKSGERAQIRIIACLKSQHCLAPLEGCEALLKLFLYRHSVDQATTTQAKTVFSESCGRSLDDAWVLSEAEIIIGCQVNIRTPLYDNTRPLHTSE